ncbi:unnamed protein product [Polarella glacialis]|uniref:Acyltransferase n=1 Tax=Polarella glacialis TaxID=89957 RepID=A0A813K589_POLGL|nr:unnamed protein product [Polarella glacialis]
MSDAAASNPKSRNKQKASGKTACQSGSPTSPDVGAALCSLPLLAGAASRPGSGHGPAVLLPAKELRRLGLSAGDVLLLRVGISPQLTSDICAELSSLQAHGILLILVCELFDEAGSTSEHKGIACTLMGFSLMGGTPSLPGTLTPSTKRERFFLATYEHTGVPILMRFRAAFLEVTVSNAPGIQLLLDHRGPQEMYRNKCGAADKRAITKLRPLNYDLAVFANAGERKYEYSYLKGRTGFMRICLEEGKDIVPCYTFRASRMYNNPGILRGVRARFSQHYFIGLVPFTGWMGTSMPLTDETTTVIFPPFEASRYQVSQLDEAHAAYLEHLKTHFDANKDQYGMPGVELVFVGNDFKDEDFVARGLRSMGMLKDEAPRAKSEATAILGTIQKDILVTRESRRLCKQKREKILAIICFSSAAHG